MEKDSKKHADACENRSYFIMKVILVILSLIVVVQFAVGFVSLKALNGRLNSLELNYKSLRPSDKVEEHDPRRSKRSIDQATFKHAMFQLRKMEERFNKSHQYLGNKHVLLLPGPPGKPGTPGSTGKSGTPGSTGHPGTPGSAGKPGTPGSTGKSGTPGSAGKPGTPGSTGKSGTPGPRGYRGIPGGRGPAGPRGYSAEVGVTYIRWGKKTCPNTGAKLVYRGYVGGSYYSHSGGGSNYVCLTRDPIYERYQSGWQGSYARMYGGEYQTYSTGIFYSGLHDHDAPCAVCRVTRRTSQMMIPGRNVCPAGWTREYKGYLMAEKHSHHRTMYTCVDSYPDYTRGSHVSRNGALFYFVEGRCGSLPCKPYIEGRELTCAVCTR